MKPNIPPPLFAPQPAALVAGTDMRDTKAGAANLGAGRFGLRLCMGTATET
mgnify:CR=1 FL=1